MEYVTIKNGVASPIVGRKQLYYLGQAGIDNTVVGMLRDGRLTKIGDADYLVYKFTSNDDGHIDRPIDIDRYIAQGYYFSFRGCKLDDEAVKFFNELYQGKTIPTKYFHNENINNGLFANISFVNTNVEHNLTITDDLGAEEWCSLHQAFQSSQFDNINLHITGTGFISTMQCMCRWCGKLKTITITEDDQNDRHLIPSSCSGVFEYCRNLTKIDAKIFMTDNIGYAFELCTKLPKVNLVPDEYADTEIKAGLLSQTFNGIDSCTDIIGIINMPEPNETFTYRKDYTHLTFGGDANLVNVKIKRCCTDLDMSPCAKLSADSVNYLLQNAVSPITDVFPNPTIKFHANIRSYIDDGSVLQDTINAVKALGFTIIVGENTL